MAVNRLDVSTLGVNLHTIADLAARLVNEAPAECQDLAWPSRRWPSPPLPNSTRCREALSGSRRQEARRCRPDLLRCPYRDGGKSRKSFTGLGWRLNEGREGAKVALTIIEVVELIDSGQAKERVERFIGAIHAGALSGNLFLTTSTTR